MEGTVHRNVDKFRYIGVAITQDFRWNKPDSNIGKGLKNLWFPWAKHTLNKKVKEISENHGTKEHQSKQLFIFYLFV